MARQPLDFASQTWQSRKAYSGQHP